MASPRSALLRTKRPVGASGCANACCVRNFVARGELSIIRFGGHTVFDPADLEALKNAKKIRRGEEEQTDGKQSVKSEV